MVFLDAHIHLLDITGLSDIENNTNLSDVRFFCNAASYNDWRGIWMIAAAAVSVTPFYGVHPWFTNTARAGWENELADYLGRASCGIGEIGLDSLRGASLQQQKEVLVRQLELACALRKPFVLHCVRAWGEMLGVLHSFRRQGIPRFMVHAFGSSPQIMEELIELGGSISFSLKDIERRAGKLQPLISAVPRERLLLETDFPHCTFDAQKDPVGAYRDCLERLYTKAAKICGMDKDSLTETVADNGTIFTDTITAR